MKVWVLEARGVVVAGYFWTGDGMAFTTSLDQAVQFARRADAERVLAGNLLLDAMPAEKELPDGVEPRSQSAAGDGAVNH
jgi:hypothetical protein